MGETVFLLFGLLLILGAAAVSMTCAVVAYLVARKRGINPWPWVICILPPVLGVAVFGLFALLTALSVLERLNRLERQDPF